MLGDIGLAKVEDLKYCSMPESMLSSYSAPELFELMANVNETIDLYAVGLILYRIYNGNHAPLEDEKTSAKAADKLRITGQALPAPMFADYEMAGIISKAAPSSRGSLPVPRRAQGRAGGLHERNQVGDAPIMPPIVADDVSVDEEAAQEAVEPVQFANTEEMDDAFKESFSPDNDMLNALIESVHKDIDQDYASSRSLEPQEMTFPWTAVRTSPASAKNHQVAAHGAGRGAGAGAGRRCGVVLLHPHRHPYHRRHGGHRAHHQFHHRLHRDPGSKDSFEVGLHRRLRQRHPPALHRRAQRLHRPRRRHSV